MKKSMMVVMVSIIAFPAFSQQVKDDDSGNSKGEHEYICLMTGEEQMARQELLKKEVFSQVEKVEELKNGYVFYFKYEEEFLLKMTDFVIAENNCCPFLTFDIQIHAKNDVMLQITGGTSKETYQKTKQMIKMAVIDEKD